MIDKLKWHCWYVPLEDGLGIRIFAYESWLKKYFVNLTMIGVLTVY